MGNPFSAEFDKKIGINRRARITNAYKAVYEKYKKARTKNGLVELSLKAIQMRGRMEKAGNAEQVALWKEMRNLIQEKMKRLK